MPRQVVPVFFGKLVDDADKRLGNFHWVNLTVEEALDGIGKGVVTELAEILAIGRFQSIPNLPSRDDLFLSAHRWSPPSSAIRHSPSTLTTRAPKFLLRAVVFE
jgi:hypothetical protein